jgi:hypothetical protein
MARINTEIFPHPAASMTRTVHATTRASVTAINQIVHKRNRSSARTSARVHFELDLEDALYPDRSQAVPWACWARRGPSGTGHRSKSGPWEVSRRLAGQLGRHVAEVCRDRVQSFYFFLFIIINLWPQPFLCLPAQPRFNLGLAKTSI